MERATRKKLPLGSATAMPPALRSTKHFLDGFFFSKARMRATSASSVALCACVTAWEAMSTPQNKHGTPRQSPRT